MLIDVHTHFELYQDFQEKALADIKKNGILSIWNCIRPTDYQEIINYATENRYILPAFGIHPSQVQNYVDKLADFSKHFKESPIYGEIGLDNVFVKNPDYYPNQLKVFEHFCSQAQKNNSLIIIHLRGFYQECLELLESYSLKKVLLHNYDGPRDFMSKFIDRGFYFSVSSTVLDEYQDKIPSWDDLQYIATNIPSDLLLLETDGPGITKDMMPSHKLEFITLKIAALRNTSFEEIEKVTTENFSKLIIDDKRLTKYHELLKK